MLSTGLAGCDLRSSPVFSPGFAIAAIVTLALGIGATTAIFTLVDGILLQPLPFPDRDRLIATNTLGFPPGVPTTNLLRASR